MKIKNKILSLAILFTVSSNFMMEIENFNNKQKKIDIMQSEEEEVRFLKISNLLSKNKNVKNSLNKFQECINNSNKEEKINFEKVFLLEKFIEYDFYNNHSNDLFRNDVNVLKYENIIYNFKNKNKESYDLLNKFVKDNNL